MATLEVCMADNGREFFELASDETLVGRDHFCDIVLRNHTVSRQHARIVRTPDGLFIEDLSSLNGTYLNGRRLEGRAPIKDQDRIHLYEVATIFHSGEPPEGDAEELAEQKAKLLNIAAIHRVSPIVELNAQRRMPMEAELHSLEVQSQGLEARQKVIEHQIADLAKKVNKDPARDSVRAPIEAQSAMYQRVSKSDPNATRADRVAARAKVLEAEAELAKFESAMVREASGGRIAELKVRLDDTAIELAEINARRRAVQELLAKMSNGSVAVEMQRLKVEYLTRDYAAASDQVRELELKQRLHVDPQIRVIPVE